MAVRRIGAGRFEGFKAQRQAICIRLQAQPDAAGALRLLMQTVARGREEMAVLLGQAPGAQRVPDALDPAP
jgi:hypothetical protein